MHTCLDHVSPMRPALVHTSPCGASSYLGCLSAVLAPCWWPFTTRGHPSLPCFHALGEQGSACVQPGGEC